MTQPVQAADERFHPFDPEERIWNESWFFSWIDLDGGPAGFFRVGVVPNQGRAILWSFVHVDGRWLGAEEARLSFDDLDLGEGLAYDRAGLRFSWKPAPPLEGSRFHFEGSLLERTGTQPGGHLPVAIDLTCAAAGPPVPTQTGEGANPAYATSRFEQPLTATGTVTVAGAEQAVRAGAHRDKSWGPREWRRAFTLGDIQGEGRQLYFAAGPLPSRGFGFVRDGEVVKHVAVLEESTVEYRDAERTHGPGRLVVRDVADPDAEDLEISLRPIGPGVTFDMAHTCEVPEHWLYYRTLVEAEVPGWGTCRGWFEASRYGIA